MTLFARHATEPITFGPWTRTADSPSQVTITETADTLTVAGDNLPNEEIWWPLITRIDSDSTAPIVRVKMSIRAETGGRGLILRVGRGPAAGSYDRAYWLMVQATGKTYEVDQVVQFPDPAEGGVWVSVGMLPQTKAIPRVKTWPSTIRGSWTRPQVTPLATINDLAQLEVETPSTTPTNLLANPTGELGSYGWTSPVPGSQFIAQDFSTGFQYVSALSGGGNWFFSDPVSITPSHYASAQWDGPHWTDYIPTPTHRARFDWLDSNQAYLSATPWFSGANERTPYGDYGEYQWKLSKIPPQQAPADARFVRLRIEIADTPKKTYPYKDAGGYFTFDSFVLASAAQPDKLASLDNLPAIQYRNVLGPTGALSINREDLNVGTATAEIRDPALDPATANTIRAGRRFRLRAWDRNRKTWDHIHLGRLLDADVEYNLKPGAARPTRITLSSADDVTTLANSARPDGVSGIAYLPAVLEGVGVPWMINGTRNHVVASAVVRNDNATALDQVAVTRDSSEAYAWLDRNGILQAWARETTGEVLGSNLVGNGGFDTNITGWSNYSNTGPISRTTTSPYAGSGCLRLNGTTQYSSGAYHAAGVPVTALKKYRLSFAVRGTQKLRVSMAWIDSLGNTLGYSSGYYEGGGRAVTGAWATITSDYTAPNGAVRAQAQFSFSKDPTARPQYIDAVSIREVTPGTVAISREVKAVLTEENYSDIKVTFSTSDVINEVKITHARRNLATGQTVEIPYGPYRDPASVAEWGPHSAEFTLQGLTDNEATMKAYAARVLAANGTPAVRVRSVTIPIRTPQDLADYGFLDLYDLVQIANDTKGVNVEMRVTSISHDITPQGWNLTLGFSEASSVASPQITPPAQTLDAATITKVLQSGIASVPLSNASTGTVNIAFPSTFDTAPQLVATAASSAFYATVSGYPTTTGAQIRVSHRDGVSTSSTVVLHWIATTITGA